MVDITARGSGTDAGADMRSYFDEPPEEYRAGEHDAVERRCFQEDLTMCSMYASTDRRLFVTAKGYLGLSPSHTISEDKICVLHGCSVPAVLRQYGQNHLFI
jgi:hypothetical protein